MTCAFNDNHNPGISGFQALFMIALDLMEQPAYTAEQIRTRQKYAAVCMPYTRATFRKICLMMNRNCNRHEKIIKEVTRFRSAHKARCVRYLTRNNTAGGKLEHASNTALYKEMFNEKAKPYPNPN